MGFVFLGEGFNLRLFFCREVNLVCCVGGGWIFWLYFLGVRIVRLMVFGSYG